jgi:hypothetical protein
MPPMLIEITPSRRLVALLIVAHAAALLTVFVLQIDWVWCLLLVGLILVSAWRTSRVTCLTSVLRLHLGRNGQCDVEKVGVRGTAVVQQYTLVFGCLIVLVLATEAGPHILVLLPDSADADALRCLRVWLRTSA